MSETEIKGLLGKKLGMTQIFDENNHVVPVTVVEAGPCVITQIRTQETDATPPFKSPTATLTLAR